jgi:hypothetical protein
MEAAILFAKKAARSVGLCAFAPVRASLAPGELAPCEAERA